MIPVTKSSAFEVDFERAALALGDVNAAAAGRFVDAVDAAVEMLAQHPEIGPVWRYGDPKRPTRYLLVPGFHGYIIFYRFEHGEVRLGRLHRAGQDLQDVLGD